jgi:hypothetical protein
LQPFIPAENRYPAVERIGNFFQGEPQALRCFPVLRFIREKLEKTLVGFYYDNVFHFTARHDKK